MNIVMVNPHWGPVLGGIQTDMLCLARELLAGGDCVTIVTTFAEFPEGRVDLSRPPTYLLPPNLHIERLEGHVRTRLRNFHPANAPLILPGLTEAILQHNPDGVIFFNVGWPLTVLPALISLRRHTPLLYRTAYHAHLSPTRLDPWRARLQLQVAGQSHRLVAYSAHERAQIIHDGKVHPEKIAVVYPGVESPAIAPDALTAFLQRFELSGRVVISHVARLGAFKGTDRLIRALPEVRRRTDRDVVLLLVGRNLEPDALNFQAHTAGVAAHVRFAGPLSDADLQLAYAASDLFALPSRYESFGIVFLEAMAHGTPVIGVRTGGVPEVIRDGETGYILDSADDDAALTDALVLLVSDQPLRERFGTAARRWVESRFRWPDAAAAMRTLLLTETGSTPERLEWAA